MKVWEQEATVNYPQVWEEKQEPGPAPAVEQIPFASVAFGAEETESEIEDLETIHWQTPLSPLPASPSRPADNQPPVKDEKRSPVREESQVPAQGESHPLAV